jgi:hypothetical protein
MASTTYGGNPYGSNPSGNNSYGTNPYGSNLDYSTSDPRKIAAQQRQQNASQYAQGMQQAQNTQDYLGNIESPLAQGQGGYNASELSQIQMTPQQQAQMVTQAGLSAGTATQAGVGAADRAAAAAGGSPTAMAAYRARAAQQAGQQAGSAMTGARVAASNTAAQRAEDIGQARIGQQNQGLSYYNSLQQQQNANAQNAASRQEDASKLGLTASQTPSTFDQVMGGVGSALSFLPSSLNTLKTLDEGDVTTGTTPAVVGENGPEKIVNLTGAGMSHGGIATTSLATLPNTPDYLDSVNNPVPAPVPPVGGTTTNNPDGSVTFQAPAKQPFWKQLGTNLKNNLLHPQAPSSSPSPSGTAAPGFGGAGSSPSKDIQSFGQGIGRVAGLFLADGGIAPQAPQAPQVPQGTNGVFTSPTRVNLSKNEAVVPLSYRAGAKVRPSFAHLPAARTTRLPYGARL